MKQYEPYFYSTRDRDTHHAASAILDVVLPMLPRAASAADVGCGVGAWLAVLREKGLETLQGFDGFWVEDGQLEIPVEMLKRVDLEQPLDWPVRYDLAISLEVAEHLPPERAPGFVEDLTRLSDYVLFSAAIPRQGGYHHVNERWQGFWANLFATHGYSPADCVRPRFWNDDSIPCWYSQNMLLYVKDSAPLRGERGLVLPLDIVHPVAWLGKVNAEDPRYGLSLAKRAFLHKYFGKPF
jgi:hypothetical protein